MRRRHLRNNQDPGVEASRILITDTKVYPKKKRKKSIRLLRNRWLNLLRIS